MGYAIIHVIQFISIIEPLGLAIGIGLYNNNYTIIIVGGDILYNTNLCVFIIIT